MTEEPQEGRSHGLRNSVIVASVAGLFSLLAVAVAHYLPSPGATAVSRSPASSVSASVRNARGAPPTSATSGCNQKLRLLSPSLGQGVQGLVGVKVRVAACGISRADEVWIVEQDPFDGNYYVVYDPNVGPKAVGEGAGTFAILDQPIGDPGDDHKRYVIMALLADSSCNRFLKTLKPDSEENYHFKTLPSHCLVGDQTTILESQPK